MMKNRIMALGIALVVLFTQIIPANIVAYAAESREYIFTGTFGENNGLSWGYVNTPYEDEKALYITGEDFLTGEEWISSDLKVVVKEVIFEDCKLKGDISGMFHSWDNLRYIRFNDLDTSEVTNMSYLFANNSLIDVDFSSLDTSNVTNMSHMFDGANGNMDATDLEKAIFDTSKVTNMSGMFANGARVNVDVEKFDTSSVTDMSYMFDRSYMGVLDLSGWDTGSVTNMSHMFGGEYINIIDVSGFNTSNVTDMSYMFNCCLGCEEIDVSGFDTRNVTNMSYMFSGCENLKALDVSNFDTSNVTDMGSMFGVCTHLKELDVSGFDTSNVTNMRGMFSGCYQVRELDVSHFDTGNVTDMGAMFSECKQLKKLDVSHFDTGNVTGSMHSMFSGCYNLKELDLSSFDTSNVTSMRFMFSGCENLKVLDVSNFDTVNVKDMRSMFGSCKVLQELNLANFNTGNVTDMDNMFRKCEQLESIDVTHFDISKVTVMDDMFSDCVALEGLDLSSWDMSGIKKHSDILLNCKFKWLHAPQNINSIDLSCELYDENGNSVRGLTSSHSGKYLVADYVPVVNPPVSEEEYLVQVVDSNGQPVSDATVTYDEQTAITDSKGNAVFQASSEESPLLSIIKDGFLSWISTGKKPNINPDTNIPKRSEKNILYTVDEGDLKLEKAEYSCGASKVNLLTSTKTLNLKNTGNLIGDLTIGNFTVTCEAIASASDIKEYQLWQGSKQIAVSDTGEFKLNVENGFTTGENCFVRVVHQAGNTVDTNINLSFVSKNIRTETSLALNRGKLSLAVDENVPFLGGTNIDIDCPELPMEVAVTDEKVYMAINVQPGDFEEDAFPDKLIEYCKDLKKNIAAFEQLKGVKQISDLEKLVGKNKTHVLPGSAEMKFGGYIEAEWANMDVAEGKIYMSVSFDSPKVCYNTVVFIFPVTVHFKASGEAGIEGTLKYDFEKGELLDGSLKVPLKGGLEAFGGVGIGEVAGVGAYGTAELLVELVLFEKDRIVDTVELTGELGVKAYVGKLEYNRPFAHNTWYLYTPNSVASYGMEEERLTLYDAAAYKEESLDYLAGESEWNGYPVATSESENGSSFVPLLENTYRNAQPVIISDGTTAYASFLRADANTDNIYVASTKMENGTWMPPVAADDTAILDDAPQLLLDTENVLWMTYAKTQENADTTDLLDYAGKQTIVVGTLNKETMAFSPVKEFEHTGYAHLQKLTMVNGVPTLVWVENELTDANSVLASENARIMKSSYVDGAWTEAEEIKVLNTYLRDFAIGDQGLAYIVDADQDLLTEDGTLVCEDWEGEVLVTIENVNGNLTYGLLPGETESSFLWNGDGKLCSLTDSVDVPGITNSYTINGDKIYYSAPDEDGAELNVVERNEDGTFGLPVQLTNTERYLENLAVVTVNGMDIAFGMLTNAIITENDVTPEKNLVWSMVQSVSDIYVEALDYDESIMQTGAMVPVTLTIGNAGNCPVEEVTITVNEENVRTETVSLQPGETKEIVVDIVCPGEVTEYRIQVTDAAVGLTGDFTAENNVGTLKLGYVNLSVEAELEQIGESKNVIATVANTGMEALSGKIKMYTEDGKLLAVRSFDQLPGDRVIVTEMSVQATLSDEALMVEVETDREELYSHDNSDMVHIANQGYEITYDLDGGIQNENNPTHYYSEDETIVLRDPEKEGCIFDGWYSGNNKITEIPSGSTSDIYLFARWKMLEYPITYELNGGINDSNNPSVYTVDLGDFGLRNATREGYEFDGWYSDPTYETRVFNVDSTNLQNMTFYAKWKVKTYRITYRGLEDATNSSENPKNYTVETDTIVLKAPTRSGYSFVGWYSDGEFKTQVREIPKGSSGNKTLYAKWTEAAHNITYHLNGGINNSENPGSYTAGADTIVLKAPTRSGYTFEGWYSDEAFKTQVTEISKGSSGDINLYAKWKVKKYTVTFNGNGATGGKMSTVSYEYNKTYTLPANGFEKKGYSFNGWNIKANGSGTAYKDKAQIKNLNLNNGKTTLYAQWKAVKYMVTYNLNGGKNNSKNPQSYYITTATKKLESPTRKGYTFKGWYSDKKCTKKVTQISTGSTGSKTFYAKWAKEKYTIKYVLNGGKNNKNNPTKYSVTTSTIKLKTPTRKGYTFKGWYSNKKCTKKVTQIKKGSTGNKTLYAKWAKEKYTIKYVLNGGKNNKNNPTKYTVTTSTIKLKKPTRKGYTFKGWYSNKKCTKKVTQIKKGSTGNKTLYAKWAK